MFSASSTCREATIIRTPAPTLAVGASPLARAVLRADLVLGRAVELAAAALLFVEILILGNGVASRYVFDSPLTWTDELASTH